MTRSARLILAATAVLAAACGPTEPPATARAPTAPLVTAAAELREVEVTTTAEAVVEAVRQSTVSAQMSGRIVDIRFDVGDRVRKGDVILRIDERAADLAVTASEAQMREAEAALVNARAQFERTRQLVAQKFLSRAALDKAEADLKTAESRMRATLAGTGAAITEKSFTTIVAPYSGVVSARHVQLGEMAAPGKPLLTGFDPSTLRVVATVASAQVPSIQAGARARIEVPSLDRWTEVRSVTVVPSADPRTHTTQVRLELPADAKGLLPGVFARAHFVTGKAARLMVPRAAVLRRSEVTAVYVVGAQGPPQLRQIRLGATADETFVEVLAGLKPGEQVALEPVKAGMATGAAV
ncbi:MAG: efflux RND transporter periplasmic adaptor subunit [Betaproteobacteria bacterium]|nr:efflux RND transporter periplasmic adaptor subunit [Betaproteobacteria bacterium]